MKHTKGPWEIHPLEGIKYDEAGCYLTGAKTNGYPFIWIHGRPEQYGEEYELFKANCRVMAAAPDLLEACEAAMPFLSQHHILGISEAGRVVALAKMTAAINKAKGADDAD